MNRLIKYFSELGRVSMHAFEMRELIGTILHALLTLAVAYLGALQIKVAIPSSELWQWTAGLWFVLFFAFVAPYRLWAETSAKLDGIKKNLVPHFEFIGSSVKIVGESWFR